MKQSTFEDSNAATMAPSSSSSNLILHCRRTFSHLPTTLKPSLFFHHFSPSEELPIINSDEPNILLHHKDWLSPSQATRIFQNLRDPTLTLPLFHQLCKRKDYKPNEALYITLINNLFTAKNFDQIDTLVATIKLDPKCCLSDDFFFNLIKAYGRSKRINLAIETLYDMPNYKCCPTIKTFNYVLNLLISSKKFEIVHEVFGKATELGVAVDACCLNIMIKGLCECGYIGAAYQVLDEFPKQGCRPNVRTFSIIMHGLCELGRLDEALVLLERMENEEGVGIDAIVFNVLISGLRKQGRVEEGIKLFDNMMVRGCHPHAGTYQEVLYCLIDGKRFSETKRFMGKMIDKRMHPSSESYRKLILGFCSEGSVEDVEWTLREMVAHRSVPTAGLWMQIVQCVLLDKQGNVPDHVGEIIATDLHHMSLLRMCQGWNA